MHISTLPLAEPEAYPLPDADPAEWWGSPAALLLAAAACAAAAVLATHGLAA